MAALSIFFRADWPFKLLLLKVLILLGLGRMSVLIMPFRRIAVWMGQANAETSLDPKPESEIYLVRVASAIEAVSKHTFWNSNCFAQALCAHWILKLRKQTHTIYFGTKKDKEGGMKAHAWLRVGNKIVTGRKGHLQYVVLGKFAHLPEGNS